MKKTTRRPSGSVKARRSAVAPLRAEYDFAAGVRGKYAKRVPRGTDLVLIDPDL